MARDLRLLLRGIVAEPLALLEAQIRESFGRVAYTHKTHEKCAELLLGRSAAIKKWQIALAAITTGGLLAELGDLLAGSNYASLIATIASTGLLALNLYTWNVDLGELAQRHKDVAVQLWLVRERYFSLLADINADAIGPDSVREERRRLQDQLAEVYATAPPSFPRAYQEARKSLKLNEELTFSDEEIDNFLPRPLQRTSTKENEG